MDAPKRSPVRPAFILPSCRIFCPCTTRATPTVRSRIHHYPDLAPHRGNAGPFFSRSCRVPDNVAEGYELFCPVHDRPIYSPARAVVLPCPARGPRGFLSLRAEASQRRFLADKRKSLIVPTANVLSGAFRMGDGPKLGPSQ